MKFAIQLGDASLFRTLSALGLLVLSLAAFAAAPPAPTPERDGLTFYVSKLGDDSDGLSWASAYHTIQQALDAVPDARGGHRIIVRPDTYMEAMLNPAYKGAEGSYNELIGDTDGSLGSGTSGEVIIDSGDPKTGFKSYDWWSTIRATQQGWSPAHTDATFSAIGWDRWILRKLYATGSDAGLFWDLTDQTHPFTVIVEDCVSIGRAFGGGVASCLSRPEEPIVFRRCNLWSLDWWGDTAGAYVRVENPGMPGQPDIFFEDCTMASPQCALKAGNFGFTTSMRIHVERCNLVALNFSQPQGTPTDGAIQSVEDGKLLHVDLVDSTIMGYKVFGVRVNKDTEKEIQYTTTGDVQAYVQFQQEVPEGIYRLQQWPLDVFASIAPPPPTARGAALSNRELIRRDMCEVSAILWNGRLLHFECIRPGSGGVTSDYNLVFTDAETGEEVARFGEGYGLAAATIINGTVYVTASRFADNDWNDVTLFTSRDLKQWDSRVIIEQEDEHLFNSSLCHGPDGFVLAYESNDRTYPAFTTKFATSKDGTTWEKLPDAMFGTDRYTACPTIRYVDGYYYVLYLERRVPRHYFETYVTRSKDLEHWELSSANPVIAPIERDDGINTSDADLIEIDGKTYLYYCVGDQLTWMNAKRGVYDGTMAEFFQSFYQQPGVPDSGTPAYRKAEEAKAERQAWFNESKFGIFVHWGLYAVRGVNNTRAYVSWAMHDDKVPVAEYEKYADEFNPQHFDADAWMALAKSAGARYMVFTSKHHEGFAMYDSALTDYDSMDTAAQRDFVAELIEAARKAGLKIGFYYSTLDWHHPDFAADLPTYVDDYMFGQVREICTNYGPIDFLWFDGEWDHPMSTWRADELVAMIRELQPDAVVNDRLGRLVRGQTRLADFFTREQMSEVQHQTAFERQHPYPWEACITIGESWGFRRDDKNFKSSAELIRTLVNVASRGGNLLLNVGPDADGVIPAHLATRLEDIGQWMARNGASIYGVTASPFAELPDGVVCTAKDKRLYLHILERPGDTIALPGLENAITGATILATGDALAFDDETKSLTLPAAMPDSAVTTIAVELDGDVRVSG